MSVSKKYKRKKSVGFCTVAFSDELENGKVRFITECGQYTIKIGRFALVDGESDEEEKLRRVFYNTLAYCLDNRIGGVSISAESIGGDPFYVIGVLGEVADEFFAKNDAVDFCMEYVFPEPDEATKLLEKRIGKINVVQTESFETDSYWKEKIGKYIAESGSDISFGRLLADFIEKKGIRKYKSGKPAYSDVYIAAGISKFTFSKIITGETKQPAKETVAALAIGLRLDADEAQTLYNLAGYYLGRTEIIDIVVRFFIEQNIYDLTTINNCLYDLEQPLLGAKIRDDEKPIKKRKKSNGKKSRKTVSKK